MSATERARSLRRDATKAERVLWRRLRAKQLGVRFRRQQPLGPFIVDFYCADAKLVVELDGGGHDDEPTRAYDADRTSYLTAHGVRVLRFWNNEVLGQLDAVVDVIYRSLPPTPTLPLEGGGGR